MQTRFMTSFPCFWLKGTVITDDDSFTLHAPNTFGGVIKTGTYTTTIDYKHMASTQYSFDIEVWQILAALIIEVLILTAVHIWWIALAASLLTVFLFIMSINTTITIRTTSGEEVDIFFVVFERKKAKTVYEALVEKIKTNGRRIF